MMQDYLPLAEKALDFLKESEDEYARLKGLMKVQPDRIKVIKAREFLNSPEKAQASKQAWAEAGEEFSKALDEYQGIVDMYELISEKRRRAELVIEMYRSVNSALKRGNMI